MAPSHPRPRRYNSPMSPVPFERLWRRLDPRASHRGPASVRVLSRLLPARRAVRLPDRAAADGSPDRVVAPVGRRARRRVRDADGPGRRLSRGLDRPPGARRRGSRLVSRRRRGARALGWAERPERRPASPRTATATIWTEVPEEESVAFVSGASPDAAAGAPGRRAPARARAAHGGAARPARRDPLREGLDGLRSGAALALVRVPSGRPRARAASSNASCSIASPAFPPAKPADGDDARLDGPVRGPRARPRGGAPGHLSRSRPHATRDA